jgi:ribosomal protein L37AE/L43A
MLTGSARARPDGKKRGVDAVQCPRCGGTAQQDPDGSWSCAQCGPVSGAATAPPPLPCEE